MHLGLTLRRREHVIQLFQGSDTIVGIEGVCDGYVLSQTLAQGALESCLLNNSDRSYPFLVSPMRFFEFWSNEMWPVLSARYTELLAERPAKQDEAS